MTSLKNPSSITPAEPGAKTYAAKLAETQGAFDDTTPTIPNAIKSSVNDRRIEPFNQLVSNVQYKKAVLEASLVLKADKAFLVHHAAVMKALANLLEYNPTVDLSPTDTEQLNQRLSATETGLAKVMQKLKEAPKYNNDESFSDIADQIKKVQESRDKLASDLLSSNYQVHKQEFINVVQSAQKDIIANRSTFWSAESKELSNSSSEKQILLSLFLSKLSSI